MQKYLTKSESIHNYTIGSTLVYVEFGLLNKPDYTVWRRWQHPPKDVTSFPPVIKHRMMMLFVASCDAFCFLSWCHALEIDNAIKVLSHSLALDPVGTPYILVEIIRMGLSVSLFDSFHSDLESKLYLGENPKRRESNGNALFLFSSI